MNNLLTEIVQATQARFDDERDSPAEWKRLAEQSAAVRKPHRFRASLLGTGDRPRVIAEIKAASPSAGTILEDVDAEAIAKDYRAGGASAISVVTEALYFKGDRRWIREASMASGLPVVMKDFIVDERQIDQAVAAGADAVLLLASLLDEPTMRRFLARIEALGRDALVEVHDEKELAKAVTAGARIIGVNNRDLRTFSVDLATAERLSRGIPPGVIRVAESGIRSAADAQRMRAAGFDAVLVGEHLLRQVDRAAAVRELAGGPLVKVCGITREEDALYAAEHGAAFLGFVFAEESPRKITPEAASAIARLVRDTGHRTAMVGVFRDQPISQVLKIADQVGLDVIQFHGSEPPATLTVCDRPVIRALGVDKEIPPARGWGDVAWMLYDRASARGGGSGETFEWSLLEGVDRRQKFFLAGGLTPDNVRSAILRVRPDGVDVSSGVEQAPGIKSADKIRRLFEEVRSS
ncbi:MAG: indole-3-glycerol phosphate synthase TrpC [Thermoanaerobaculia bacterium]